jgi:hypothetical protein
METVNQSCNCSLMWDRRIWDTPPETVPGHMHIDRDAKLCSVMKCRGQRMSGAIPPLPQYAFMAWCSVKAQGQLYLYLLYSL